MDKRKILGINIKKHRLIKGWEQKELAEATGLGVDSISKIERGKENVGIDNLMIIAEKLDVDIEELFLENSKIISLRILLSEHSKRGLEKMKDLIDDILKNKER